MKQICKTGEEEEANEIWFVSHFQDVSSCVCWVCLGFFSPHNTKRKAKHFLNCITYSVIACSSVGQLEFLVKKAKTEVSPIKFIKCYGECHLLLTTL